MYNLDLLDFAHKCQKSFTFIFYGLKLKYLFQCTHQNHRHNYFSQFKLRRIIIIPYKVYRFLYFFVFNFIFESKFLWWVIIIPHTNEKTYRNIADLDSMYVFLYRYIYIIIKYAITDILINLSLSSLAAIHTLSKNTNLHKQAHH